MGQNPELILECANHELTMSNEPVYALSLENAVLVAKRAGSELAGFHRRWMGSNEAKLEWCSRVSRMKIDMMCPQHGAIYQGLDVERFINWFAELPVGVGVRNSVKS